MNRIIINADDCGYNQKVNNHIEAAIEQKRISSATIMANMDDLGGAIRLYSEHCSHISFGFHMNMTEGSPLTYSQELLDLGFFKEVEGKVVLNGNPYRRKVLSKSARQAIYSEVLTQAHKIMDSGVQFSHIDSHHFMHQAVFMIPLLPKLCKELGVVRVRNYRNYMPIGLNKSIRSLWAKLIRTQNSKVIFPDVFVDYQYFYECYAKGIIYHKGDDCIELMCHPGGIYSEEEALLMNTDCEEKFNCELINYNEL